MRPRHFPLPALLRPCSYAAHMPGLPPNRPHCRPQEGAGWAEAGELEWGRPGWLEGPVRRLAEQGVDLVVAADCCYIDQDGKSPSTPVRQPEAAARLRRVCL